MRFSVPPNQLGFLYVKNKLEKKLEPGIYDFFDYSRHLHVVILPSTSRILNVVNQEVLTKDNIALRFSYFVEYRISIPEAFVDKFDVFSNSYDIFSQAEQLIHNLSQVYLRKEIAEIESERLNEKRNDILTEIPASLQKDLQEVGVEIVRLLVRDLSFPKAIQDLFSKQLEATVRAKADLENARSQVATARALKNASELMKGDENIKFVQFMETINKIAEKGKHTFVIGELGQNVGGLK
ncbi:MAG: slipin family protein [Acidobacteriota bacterium]